MVSRIDTSSHSFITPRLLSVCIDLASRVPGMRVYRTGMTMKLVEKTRELNTALLKIIEKDSSIERLSEQLESKRSVLILFLHFLRVCRDTSIPLFSSETRAELEQSEMAQVQVAVELGQARNAGASRRRPAR
jgi:hypothetical protein